MSAALAAFESFFNTDAGDPLIRAFVAHYQFEAIHPFLDGNGRIGRVLLALMVYRWCGLDQPWLYLSPYFERHKDEYIDRLFSVSSRSELEDWYKFCLEATIEQTRDSMRRIDELVRLKAEYQSRIVKGSARLHSIVEGLFETPLVTVTRIAAEFKVTYPTARADILKLERKGILEEVEHYYPKAFVASGVVKAAIED
jgi:Fic family protein